MRNQVAHQNKRSLKSTIIMVTLIGIVIGVGFVYEVSSFSSASASALSSVKASLSLTPGAGSVGFDGALGTLVPGDTRVEQVVN